MTRPAEDAEAAARLLRGMGHEVHCAPLMTIAFDEPRPIDLGGVQSFLATSANGIRALMHHRPDSITLGIPVLCVGDATARMAKEAGFADVRSAGGDVDSLAALAGAALPPGRGALLHMAGQARAGDLKALLAPYGHDVRIEVLYHAVAVNRLDEATTALVRASLIDAVLLYSARTAHIYVDLVQQARLSGHVQRMEHFCLSGAVADTLRVLDLDAERLRVASAPTQDALFGLLGG